MISRRRPDVEKEEEGLGGALEYRARQLHQAGGDGSVDQKVQNSLKLTK